MILFDDPPDDELDDEFPLGDGDADRSTHVHCPYCGAEVEMLVDPGGGESQSYVEDCEVCCQPWHVHVTFVEGQAYVNLTTEDGE